MAAEVESRESRMGVNVQLWSTRISFVLNVPEKVRITGAFLKICDKIVTSLKMFAQKKFIAGSKKVKSEVKYLVKNLMKISFNQNLEFTF